MEKVSIDNINLLWAQLIVNRLADYGISHFCYAPGARSAPLTLAAIEHPSVNSYHHFDERGLAFYALGLAKVTREPVVIITTSGSAVANLLPAVAEACYQSIPIFLLTADRPEELHHCGANQVMPQLNLFQDFVCQQVSLATPTMDIQPDYVISSVDKLISEMITRQQVVQLNCPYREPFLPSIGASSQSKVSASSNINSEQYAELSHQALAKSKLEFSIKSLIHNKLSAIETTLDLKMPEQAKALVIIGQQDDVETALAIVEWAKGANIPVIADCQSQVQGHIDTICFADLSLCHQEFKEWLSQARWIIQFGGRLVSKRLNQWLSTMTCHYWLIEDKAHSGDPLNKVTQHINQSVVCFLKSLSKQSVSFVPWQKLNSEVSKHIEENIKPYIYNDQPLTELSLAANVIEQLDSNDLLYLSNSMPIRLTDMLTAQRVTQATKVLTNRGLSGIDGLVASACGAAKAQQLNAINYDESNGLCVLFIGDTALMYDLNSLALACNLPIVIVVINNHGGGIFNMLPIPTSFLEQGFIQPHQLTFEPAAKMFGLAYAKIETKAELYHQFAQARDAKQPCLIEVDVANEQASEQLKQLYRELAYDISG